MTDNDIIKALDHELFINQSEAGYFRAYCDGVPKWILIEALSLINRQKAEIERLNKANTSVVDHLKKARRQLKTAKAEAIKEFVSELMKKAGYESYGHGRTVVRRYLIDVDCFENIVKEKVGE